MFILKLNQTYGAFYISFDVNDDSQDEIIKEIKKAGFKYDYFDDDYQTEGIIYYKFFKYTTQEEKSQIIKNIVEGFPITKFILIPLDSRDEALYSDEVVDLLGGL